MKNPHFYDPSSVGFVYAPPPTPPPSVFPVCRTGYGLLCAIYVRQKKTCIHQIFFTHNCHFFIGLIIAIENIEFKFQHLGSKKGGRLF
jgi:hypothetical protein